MPRLTITSLEGQENGGSFDLKLGLNRLGRTSENDLPIDHPTISTLHCQVVWMNDSVVIRDCDSTNGTFIDGERINTAPLEPGQVLRVGAIELVLDSAKAAISVPDLSAADTVAQPTPPPGTLPCLNHSAAPARFHCPTCEKDFCDECVRTLKLLGGHVHKLCPLCSAHCEPIVYEHKAKRRSLLRVMQDAFHLPGKGKTQKMD
jgi:hypothetical protein